MKGEEMGTIRETFFHSQVRVLHDIKLSQNGNFLVDGKYTFKIGGKSKKIKQIQELADAYIVSDDIEKGAFNQIPLWIFGFLY
jgi:hypothetical protein